jgi:hypothetical protein
VTRKTKIGVVVSALVFLAAYLFISPWLTVHQMRSAAELRNAEALAEHVDFPSLRQSLKDQLNVPASMTKPRPRVPYAQPRPATFPHTEAHA